MLELINVNTTLGEFSLENISFKVDKGEIVVILGLSGSGKTTILKAILGLYKLSSGKIIYNKQDITDFPINKRGIAYVPQNLLLYPHMNVYENLNYPLKLKKVPKEQREKKILEILKFMDMTEKIEAYPSELSVGQQQKLAIARAFVIDAPLILMDEPLTNIDPPKRHEILSLIKELQQSYNKAIIYTTHNLSEASQLASKIIIIDSGKIIRTASVREILNSPQLLSVAKLLNFENIFQGKVVIKEKKTTAIVEKNGVKIQFYLPSNIPKSETITFTIRPESIIISTKPPEAISARNCLKGKIIEIIENLDGTVKVHVDCGVVLKSLITRNALEELKLEKGKEVFLVFKATAIKLLD